MALYICSKCGYGSASWLGKCPNCGEFNTFEKKEEPSETRKKGIKKSKLTSFKEIGTKTKARIPTHVYEFDRVLGSGIVPGELILLSGEPGVGKSTLLLQVLKDVKTVYISGEESAEQVKDRAVRLHVNLDNFLFSDDLQVEGIIEGINELEVSPEVIVIDSIQTISSVNIDSPPGSVSQLKEVTNTLIGFAKRKKIAVIAIGHVTKGGDVAGPKTLEHLVDCVLAFEGERISQFRILRATKNRFGTTEEIGIFQMGSNGLLPVTNPLVFLEDDSKHPSVGKAIVGVHEGNRSVFFEIQALSAPTPFNNPRRVVKGVDFNKVLLLLAVIRKHLGISFDRYDLYINVVGGVSVKSPSSDLGIVAAILSSIGNKPLPKQSVFIGEVGLLGEIRKNPTDLKVQEEARRLKFRSIYSPSNISHMKDLKKIIVPS